MSHFFNGTIRSLEHEKLISKLWYGNTKGQRDAIYNLVSTSFGNNWKLLNNRGEINEGPAELKLLLLVFKIFHTIQTFALSKYHGRIGEVDSLNVTSNFYLYNFFSKFWNRTKFLNFEKKIIGVNKSWNCMNRGDLQ